MNSYADLVNRAKEIESTYKAWQKSRKELEEWDGVASQFREYEKDRAPLLEQIAVEKAKLEAEQRSLLGEEGTIHDQKSVMGELQNDIEKSESLLKEAEEKIARRLDLENERNSAARTPGRIESRKRGTQSGYE